MEQILETENLILLTGDKHLLKSAIAGNAQLEKHIKFSVPENWTEFGKPVLECSLEKINASRDEQAWWTYFPIHKHDRKLIGCGGYKGKPNAEGCVEIGYEIAGDYRNKGLATELAQALVQNALKDPRTKIVQAHTLAEENASTKVLIKCGFTKTEELEDPEDGLLWKWELRKQPPVVL